MKTSPHHPFTIALKLLREGLKEIPGPKANALIEAMNFKAGAGANEDAPWCGSFVFFCHWILGYACPANPAGAQQWLKVGEVIPLHKAERGDVVVFWRDNPQSWKGHVGFFESFTNSGEIQLLGGNQGDQVSIVLMPRSRVLGVRRPVLLEAETIASLPEAQKEGREV